jgi:hypothetical protein
LSTHIVLSVGRYKLEVLVGSEKTASIFWRFSGLPIPLSPV